MSERPIPEDLMAIARALRTGVIWESNASVELIARTLLDVRAKERERCIHAAMKAMPRAHTYASENADLYRAQDHARDLIIKAIEAGQ